jgi:hypothetical protein
MNHLDWYYRQIVTQSEMDQAFEWAQDADWNQIADLVLYGVNDAYDVTEETIPTMNVLVAGPGVAQGKTGERIYMPDTSVAVDMSQDEYGSPTAVAAAPNERWVSLFVRFLRRPSDPAVDGNSITVYTRQYEDYELFVRQASEQPVGTNNKPALLSDAILLCDVQLVFGQTAVTNSDIDLTRREDYVRKTGTTIGDLVAGDPKTALAWLYDELDTYAVPSAQPFTFTSTWEGAATVGQAAAPNYPGAPVANVADALNAIVWDLAQEYGAALVGIDAESTLTHTGWPAGDVDQALRSLANDFDLHVGGSAPNHDADAIDFDDTHMTGLGYAASSDVQGAINELVTHLQDASSGTSGTEAIRQYNIGSSGGGWYALTSDNLRAHLVTIMGWLNYSAGVQHNELVPRHDGASLPVSSRHWHMPSSMAGNVRPGATVEMLTTRNFAGEVSGGVYAGSSMQTLGFGNFRSGLGVNILGGCVGHLPQDNKLTPFFVADDLDAVIYFDETDNLPRTLFSGTWPVTTYTAFAVACDAEKTYVACRSGSNYLRLIRFDTETQALEDTAIFATADINVPTADQQARMIVTQDALYVTMNPATGNGAIFACEKSDFTNWDVGGGNLPSGVVGYPDGALVNVSGAIGYSWWNVSGGGLANTGHICHAYFDVSSGTVTTVSGGIHSGELPLEAGDHVYDGVYDGVYSWWATTNTATLFCCYERDDGVAVISYDDRWFVPLVNDHLDGAGFLGFDGQRLLWVGPNSGDMLTLTAVDVRRACIPTITSSNLSDVSDWPMYLTPPDVLSNPGAYPRSGRVICAGGITAILGDYQGTDEVFFLFNTSTINGAL